MKQLELINECLSKKAKEMKMRADSASERLDSDCWRLMDVVRERGASVWLSALPLKEFRFEDHFEMPSVLDMGGNPSTSIDMCVW